MKNTNAIRNIIMAGAICLLATGCGNQTILETAGGIEGVPISSELLADPSESSQEDEKIRWKDMSELKKAYEGTWVCGRASMEIVFTEGDIANVTILWPGSAFELMEWNYTCVINEQVIMDEGKGKKILTVYGSEDAEPVRTLEYEDGAASFEMKANGKLSWNDRKDDAGTDMEFEKVEITN